MTDRSVDPVVAFGLMALESALDAKRGALARGKALVLSAARARMIPGDAEAERACAHFEVLAAVDQARAGAYLHDWLTGWPTGGAMVAPVRFPWQERADLQ